MNYSFRIKRVLEKPKQPHSSFMIWLSQRRNQVKGSSSEQLKEAEIATKGRELWSFMSRDDKFQAAKAYYEVAMNRDRHTAIASSSGTDEPEKKRKVHKVVQSTDDNEDDEPGYCSSCSGSS